MVETIVSAERVATLAREAAERGDELVQACPWPLDSCAGELFAIIYADHAAVAEAA